ncbi:hypothetical protein Taro_030652 [Colocasia esculenta]|uniref:Uncharacterized protein n=1 Tax=Colocasia esculenta TaxID=4460 RepID=A0A843W0U6_COLES|nr:hypothetical protein [Colocasia esculenta]
MPLAGDQGNESKSSRKLNLAYRSESVEVFKEVDFHSRVQHLTATVDFSNRLQQWESAVDFSIRLQYRLLNPRTGDLRESK